MSNFVCQLSFLWSLLWREINEKSGKPDRGMCWGGGTYPSSPTSSLFRSPFFCIYLYIYSFALLILKMLSCCLWYNNNKNIHFHFLPEIWDEVLLIIIWFSLFISITFHHIYVLDFENGGIPAYQSITDLTNERLL